MEASAGVNAADIVIVGAGVMGSSIALQLAVRKAGRVVVLDRGHVGEGMSARSSALVRMHYSFRPEVELAVLSLRMFEAWPDLVHAPSLLREVGFVRFVGPRDGVSLRANVAMQKRCGVAVQLIGEPELSQLLPGWRIDKAEEAAYEPHGAFGDGSRAASEMMSRARELGVQYQSEVAVEGLRRSGDKVVGVETSSGYISAGTVICATGPWTPQLLAGAGVSVPIESELHEIAIVRHAGTMPTARLACIDSRSKTYFRPDGAETSLVGTFHGSRDVDVDAFPQRPPLESLATAVGAAANRWPALGEGGLAGGYCGVYDMTPDARPLLGHVPGVEGAYLAAGFSGTGFKLAPAIGVVMSELVLDGRASSVDITSFSPNRFAEGNPVRPPFEYEDSALG